MGWRQGSCLWQQWPVSHVGYPAATSLCQGFARGHLSGMGCGKGGQERCLGCLGLHVRDNVTDWSDCERAGSGVWSEVYI